jgi:tRNA threonylcarbamoyladenosine biosynthesis protein TsaB
MIVLGIDAALTACSAAVLVDGVVRAEAEAGDGRSYATRLPDMVREVLAGALPDLVAVTVGPGSFTGLRASIALAQGVALGAGCPAVAVSVAEALAEEVGAALPLWVALDSRRGRIFLDRGAGMEAVTLEAVAAPAGRVALAGDAAAALAARLRELGAEIVETDVVRPRARAVAAAGGRRAVGALPPLALRPLYVDPPQAALPKGGLRPAPQPA